MKKLVVAAVLVLLATISTTTIRSVVASATVTPAPAPGQVTCAVKATLKFSPPLTNAGGGTNPTTFTGHLTGCSATDQTVITSHGKLTGTFGPSSPPVTCPSQTSGASEANLSAAWSGKYHASPTGFSVGPSALTASGVETVTNGSDDVGLELPGGGNSATTTGSFARSSPDGWSAAIYTADTPSAIATMCSSRAGIKKLTLTGTVTVGVTYGFAGPREAVTDGTDVWVANYFNDGDSVTEFNAATGAWIRTLSGAPYGFSNPSVLTYGDPHVWVLNGNSVVEIDAATGAWIQTLSGGSYGFNGPDAAAFDGSHLWILNGGNNSVTEIDATTGAWIQTLSGGSYGFDEPEAASFDGSNLWIVNELGDSVTEISATTGTWIRTLSGAPYGFSNPNAVVFDGSNVWVTNYADSVTEFSASNGVWVRTLSINSFGFDTPDGVAFDGDHVWVLNPGFSAPYSRSITEIDASTGELIQTQATQCNGYPAFPEGETFGGSHIWVTLQPNASYGTDCVAEFNPSDGDLVQTLQG